MLQTALEVRMDPKSRKATLIAGTLMLLLGLVGIIVPQVLTIAVSLWIAALLLVAGLFLAYLAWQGYRSHWTAWLKAFVLLALGLLVLFNPFAGAGILGLVLAVYFLFDGFAGIGLGMELRPLPGWAWLALNGVLSLVLAAILLFGWPFSSTWMIGLLVGISLLFDGIALLFLGLSAKPVR